MSKKKKVQVLHVLNKPSKAENELANAIIEREEARVYFERARTYLMRCTRRVQDIKAGIYYGKEASHV